MAVSLRVLGLCGVFLLSATEGFSSQEGPRFVFQDGQYTVILPEPMKAALRQYDPSFTPFTYRDYHPDIFQTYDFNKKQSLFAVIGDFNGDGIQDVALHGRSQGRTVIVCILSKEGKFEALEVTPTEPRWKNGLEAFLAFRIKVLSDASSDRQTSINDAFELVSFRRKAALYYFKDGEFTADETVDLSVPQ